MSDTLGAIKLDGKPYIFDGKLHDSPSGKGSYAGSFNADGSVTAVFNYEQPGDDVRGPYLDTQITRFDIKSGKQVNVTSVSSDFNKINLKRQTLGKGNIVLGTMTDDGASRLFKDQLVDIPDAIVEQKRMSQQLLAAANELIVQAKAIPNEQLSAFAFHRDKNGSIIAVAQSDVDYQINYTDPSSLQYHSTVIGPTHTQYNSFGKEGENQNVYWSNTAEGNIPADVIKNARDIAKAAIVDGELDKKEIRDLRAITDKAQKLAR